MTTRSIWKDFDGNDTEAKIARIVAWLRQQLAASGQRGFVLGMSGGVDSALAAQLIVRACPDQALGVIMPAGNDPADRRDGIAAAEAAGLPWIEVELTEPRQELFDRVDAALTAAGRTEGDPLMCRGNIGARLRMTTLYAVAGRLGYLVVGTDNLAELYTGYFTKYGDGGVDILPLAHLLKGEVFELAAALGVPEQVLKRKPTAGFFGGQTDEEEMGVDYQTLDRYLQGIEPDAAKKEKIEFLHRISEHKRQPLPKLE